MQLGSVTAFPSNVWTGSTLYLGVTVGNDPEMTPREQITSVPYALMCAQADHAAAADSATMATNATNAANATTAATASALSCSGCVTPAMIQTGSLRPVLSITAQNPAAKTIATGGHDYVCAGCSTGVLVSGNCWWDSRGQQLYMEENQTGSTWCCSFGNDSGGTNVGHASANCLTVSAVP